MTYRALRILADALTEYVQDDVAGRADKVAHLKQQLKRHEQGESIGFPLHKDYVSAGKAFINLIEKE